MWAHRSIRKRTCFSAGTRLAVEPVNRTQPFEAATYPARPAITALTAEHAARSERAERFGQLPMRDAHASGTPSSTPTHHVAITPQPRPSSVGSSVSNTGGCPIVKYSTQIRAVTVLLADWTGPGPAGSPEAALGDNAVPEPSTLLLTLLATLGLSFYRRWRRRPFSARSDSRRAPTHAARRSCNRDEAGALFLGPSPEKHLQRRQAQQQFTFNAGT